ncbi:hypothetical protein [Geodermatophilus sp. SYSU D00815]
MPTGNETESPAAPPIPSFASLRDPRRRTPVDVLVPAREPDPEPAPAPVAPTRPATRPAPRPAEWADLLHLGVRVARASAAVPGRLLGWTAAAPGRCVRRLLGG